MCIFSKKYPLFLAILFLLLYAHCINLASPQDNNTTISGSVYGSAVITVLYPTQEEKMKILDQGGGAKLLAMDVTGDTLYQKVWILPDTIPAGFSTGPIPASDSIYFILYFFNTQDTITHWGSKGVHLTAGAAIDVNILTLSRFGSIRVKMAIPLSVRQNISRIEMVVAAKEFSPKICDLTLSSDSAAGELAKIPTGENRIITLFVYDAKNRPLYTGKDTISLEPGYISTVNIQLQLTGITANVTAQVGSDGVVNLQPYFPGQVLASSESGMVFVPAGDFIFGLETEEKTIRTDSFWIDKYEVTNGAFLEFLKANPESLHLYADSMRIDTAGNLMEAEKGFQTHPITQVSWYGADAFCRWKGKKLPSDTLWEKAARGTDGRTYPWGEAEPDSTLLNYNDRFKGTTPVDGHLFENGKSIYGAYDMSGNVYEWCGTKDPDGTSKFVRKGGGWNSTKPYCLSAYTGKDSRTTRTKALGFRCAKY
jgi:formylglycine-generating enzyme required for sulfatase activity